MTLIRRGYLDVNLTFKIDEISMSSPRSDVVSISNQRTLALTPFCVAVIIFSSNLF